MILECDTRCRAARVLVSVVLVTGSLLVSTPVRTADAADEADTAVVAFVADAATRMDSMPVSPALVKRWRAVTVSGEARERIGGEMRAAIAFNLFDDVSVVATGEVGERRSDDAFTWIGRPQGSVGDVLLVVRDGSFTGHFALVEGTFEIRPVGDGTHVVFEVDPSADKPDATLAGQIAGSEIDLLTPTSMFPATTPLASAEPDPTAIDVMIVWTPRARTHAGGAAAMEDLARLMVAEANVAFANSGIEYTLRLVHAQEVDYEETEYPAQDLINLGCPAPPQHVPPEVCEYSGPLDAVHRLRNRYAADMISMIIWNPDACEAGIAFSGVRDDAMYYPYIQMGHGAFSVVDVDYATTGATFAHEIGHNLGAAHERGEAYNRWPYSRYAAAHVQIGVFRTIMAEPFTCGSQGCPRLLYFSNPEVTVTIDGVTYPTGSDSPRRPENNARVINEVATVAVNFRELPGTLDSDGDRIPDYRDLFPTVPSLCLGRPATIIGTSGPDPSLMGTDGNDVIMGLAGDDVINGARGDDIICGNLGDDKISGGLGWDLILGDNDVEGYPGGSDRLYGGAGGDRLDGAAGDDRLLGGKGSDTANGGGGTDTCKAEEVKYCEL